MYTIHCHTGEALKHKTDDDAVYYSFTKPATLFIKEAKDISVGLLIQNILALYKKVTGEPLPPTTSRKVAAEALLTAVKKHSTVAPILERDQTMPAIAKKNTRRVARAAARRSGEKVTRSVNADKTVTKVERKNPFRDGTARAKAFDKLPNSGSWTKALASGVTAADIRAFVFYKAVKVK